MPVAAAVVTQHVLGLLHLSLDEQKTDTVQLALSEVFFARGYSLGQLHAVAVPTA